MQTIDKKHDQRAMNWMGQPVATWFTVLTPMQTIGNYDFKTALRVARHEAAHYAKKGCDGQILVIKNWFYYPCDAASPRREIVYEISLLDYQRRVA